MIAVTVLGGVLSVAVGEYHHRVGGLGTATRNLGDDPWADRFYTVLTRRARLRPRRSSFQTTSTSSFRSAPKAAVEPRPVVAEAASVVVVESDLVDAGRPQGVALGAGYCARPGDLHGSVKPGKVGFTAGGSPKLLAFSLAPEANDAGVVLRASPEDLRLRPACEYGSLSSLPRGAPG